MSDGSQRMTAPEPPAQPRTFRVSQLRGTYLLQMTATLGTERGERVVADVVIDSDSSGHASVHGHWPEYFSLTPDSTHRGDLTIDFDSRSRRLSLTLGNPGLRWTDTGVILDVFRIEPGTIVGRWVDGGLSVHREGGLHPQGWFCLVAQDH
ncbi:MAG TPA: hypothetical protein VFK13_08255 [Gemmatimonadaceae bacterium]|nr:hypothetical protein [Gemmatimonadaceae bacterium]